MATFHFDLVSPEKLAFSGEVDQVDVPGVEGDFGVLAGHAPVVAVIRPGILTITAGGVHQKIIVLGGLAEMSEKGLTVLAALIAYAAGRASRPPTAAPEAAGSALPVGSAAPQKPAGPAMRAAGAFRRSLDRVVRSCDLPTGSDRDASILGLALAHCGLTLRAPASALTAPPLDPIITNDRPPSTRVKPARTSKDPAQAPIPVTSKGDTCIAGCETDRKSCNDHCGAEPTESSLYDGYMRCRSRCLSATSHCRLACPQ